jgi:hypothetical protein
VAYYVPLGSRGLLLRLGTSLIGFFGGLVYWTASVRRRLIGIPLPVAVELPELEPSAP